MDRLSSDAPCPNRPKRSRQDSCSHRVTKQESQLLSIDEVLSLISAQSTYDGGVNCQVCGMISAATASVLYNLSHLGKLYKSKVCFVKHIWEHSVYWSVFEGVKNQDRVLSIQGAIILCYALGSEGCTESNPDLCNLLVTYPHVPEKKTNKESPDLRCSENEMSDDADGLLQNSTQNDDDIMQVRHKILNRNSTFDKSTLSINGSEKRKPSAILKYAGSSQFSKSQFSPTKSRMVTGQSPRKYLDSIGVSHDEDNFVSPVKRKRED